MAYVDFEGTVSWYKGFETNRDMGDNLEEGSDTRNKIEAEQGHYVCNVYITPEVKKQMIADGVPNSGMVGQLFKEDADGNLFYKCKRPHFNTKVNQGEGKVFGPPVTVDADGDTWDTETPIGNGSKVKIRLDVWEKKIVTWHATKVLDLVEYEADETGLGGF
jgi:hypothetical protein